MTCAPSEKAELARAIELEQQGRHGGPRKQAGNIFALTDQGDTRDLAAKAAGLGIGKTYEVVKHV